MSRPDEPAELPIPIGEEPPAYEPDDEIVTVVYKGDDDSNVEYR